MKKECVFEIGGEGGSIAIHRVKEKEGYIYIFNHNETDFSDSGLDVNYSNELSSFEQAFKKLRTAWRWWYILSLQEVHKDYKSIVSIEYLKELNNVNNKNHNFSNSITEFENILGVNFNQDKETVFTGLYDIIVKPLTKITEYDYENINGISILKGIREVWSEIGLNQKQYGFETEGVIEIVNNSIVIKDKEGKIEFILSSDKYFVETRAISETIISWKVG